MKLMGSAAYAAVFVFLLQLVSGATAKLTVDDLIHNRRTGTVAWGKWYDIPGAGGARMTVFNEHAANGNPIAAGVKLTKQFLANVDKIPCVYESKAIKGLENSCTSSIWTPFAKTSPINFLGFNYNTHGHPPVGIYSKPHFDFHFYLVAPAIITKYLDPKTNGGPCPPGLSAKAHQMIHRAMPAQCYPTPYLNVGAASPLMGNHLINPAANEFTVPGSFNATFLYGAFNARITYFEPMITVETLKSKSFCGPIPALPKEFPVAGWYPTTWCYYTYPSRTNGDTFVELRDYIWKDAGCKDAKQGGAGYYMGDPKAIPAGCPYAKPPKAAPMPKRK